MKTSELIGPAALALLLLFLAPPVFYYLKLWAEFWGFK